MNDLDGLRNFAPIGGPPQLPDRDPLFNPGNGLPFRVPEPGQEPRMIGGHEVLVPRLGEWNLDHIDFPVKKEIRKFTKAEIEQLQSKKIEILRKRTKETYIKCVCSDEAMLIGDTIDCKFTDSQKEKYTEILNSTPDNEDFMLPEEYYNSLAPEREIIRQEKTSNQPL